MIISVEMKSIHDIVMLDAIVDLWKSKWKADEVEEEEDDEEDDDTVSENNTDDDEEEADKEIRRIFRACGFVFGDDRNNGDDDRRKPRR